MASIYSFTLTYIHDTLFCIGSFPPPQGMGSVNTHYCNESFFHLFSQKRVALEIFLRIYARIFRVRRDRSLIPALHLNVPVDHFMDPMDSSVRQIFIFLGVVTVGIHRQAIYGYMISK